MSEPQPYTGADCYMCDQTTDSDFAAWGRQHAAANFGHLVALRRNRFFELVGTIAGARLKTEVSATGDER